MKLENVLFDNDVKVKIMDFGCAKDFTKSPLMTKTGTDNYMAPELHSEENMPYKGPPVDIFALGAVLYIMVTS